MRAFVQSIFLVFSVALAGQLAYADDASFESARRVFQNAGQSGAFFSKSYGYALFPTIGKGGLGVGGAHGRGRVYAGGVQSGTVSMTQLTIGLQMGAQAYSQVIFFQDRRAYEEFTSGNFEFGAQATAVAITAGASAEATTGGGTSAGISGGRNDASTVSGGWRKGMAVFTVAKGGLMYEASIGGQKFNFTPL